MLEKSCYFHIIIMKPDITMQQFCNKISRAVLQQLWAGLGAQQVALTLTNWESPSLEPTKTTPLSRYVRHSAIEVCRRDRKKTTFVQNIAS